MHEPANFDFHAHSTASDGLLRPEAVVDWALTRGVDAFALTDHDTLEGFEAAQCAANAAGLWFVAGVEISAEWQGQSVHVVGLGVDPLHAGLLAGLQSIRGGRIARARRMGEALAERGIPDAFEGAMRHATNPDSISRAHFARYLVEIGLFKEQSRVFEHYLTPGKPGYVKHRWADLAEAVAWIRAAGGIATLAHPGRYKLSAAAVAELLEAFRAAGGEALEVVSGSHTPDHVRRFAREARRFGFYASRGSDFHGQPDSAHGSLAPLPEGLEPVWRRLAHP